MHPIAALKAFWQTLFQKVILKGEAALKLAENDVKSELVKARLAVIDDANKAKADALALYQAYAVNVHTEADKIKSDFDALLAKL